MSEELHPHLPPGTKIDHFILDEVIGTGGFSITYRAHDERLNRKVAIKEYFPTQALRAADHRTVVPRSGVSHGDDYRFGLEKFLEEARLLAQFNHPNIVRVETVIVTNGTAYLVMELVAGETLAATFKRSDRLAEAELTHLLRGLLDGLEVVHSAEMLHRDIKPSNIYLRTDGSPVLLDFGAARYASGQHSHSLTGIVSRGYSPPEQNSERAKKQGPWSDLYALGATLYECITGKYPPHSPDRLMAHAEDEPDPMEPAVEAGKGRFSSDLLEAIDWMLAPRATSRPQSVRQLRGRRVGVLDADSTTPSGPPVVSKDVASGNAATPAARTSDETILVQPTIKSKLNRSANSAVHSEPVRAPLPADSDATIFVSPNRAAVEPGNRQSGDVFQDEMEDGALGPEMVVIPAGEFRMGNLSDPWQVRQKPVHKVTISKPFAMGRYVVTAAEFRRFVENTNYDACHFNYFGTDVSLPAVNTSWDDTQAYVRWLSEETGNTYRLPSESEWEYAARAGRPMAYPWGNEIDPSHAKFDSDSPIIVGQYPANAFGLHDMIGNVWEWVEDCWHVDYRGAPSDGSSWITDGDCRSHVLRGGSWANTAGSLRSANRHWSYRESRSVHYGFRLLQDL